MLADVTLRPSECATGRPLRADAVLTFFGTVPTPWTRREDWPRQGTPHGPECRLVQRGTALVALVRREGSVLVVRGLDCLEGTPLLDLKPDRCAHSAPEA